MLRNFDNVYHVRRHGIGHAAFEVPYYSSVAKRIGIQNQHFQQHAVRKNILVDGSDKYRITIVGRSGYQLIP